MTEQELRSLDAWIARYVMRWRAEDANFFVYQAAGDAKFRPTESAMDAMSVLKQCAAKLCGDCEPAISLWLNAGAVQFCISAPYDDSDMVTADTLELCICLFAKQLFATDGPHGST